MKPKKQNPEKITTITKRPEDIALLVANAVWCGQQAYEVEKLPEVMGQLMEDTRFSPEEIAAVMAHRKIFVDLLEDEEPAPGVSRVPPSLDELRKQSRTR